MAFLTYAPFNQSFQVIFRMSAYPFVLLVVDSSAASLRVLRVDIRYG